MREREEKVVELGQAMTNEKMQSIREDLSLKSALNGLKSLRKEWNHVLLNLVVSTRPLQHSVRIHGPLLFFCLSFFVLGEGTSLFFFCSCPPSSSNRSSFSNPNTTPPSHSQSPPQRRPEANGRPNAIYTSQRVDIGVISYLWALACVLLKVHVRRLNVIGIWSWLTRRSRR